MKHGISLALVAFMALPACHSFLTADVESPPNVVIIFVDDMGYSDVGVYGAQGIKTPHLDQMAADGMRFTDFYVTQPVCTASRLGLMTGCYPNRLGMHGAIGPSVKYGIHSDEFTLAELCKSRGFNTAAFGKWHLGHHSQFLPQQHGFDEYAGIPYSNDMWPKHPESPNAWPVLPFIEGSETVSTVEEQSWFTEYFTARSEDFIARSVKEEKPFFLYLAHPMPHVPLYASSKFTGSSESGLYGDVIQEIDSSVGRVLSKLDELGVGQNTLVIFSSDNGPWLSYGEHSGTCRPLREGKGTTFEGGIRVPFIAKLPGRIPRGSVCAEPVMTIDVLPTLAQLLAVPLPNRSIDGLNILPLLLAQPDAKSPHEALYFYYGVNQLQAVRCGDWKLHFPHGYRSMVNREPGVGGIPGKYGYSVKTGLELYNLREDISESRDLADQNPKVVAHLTALADVMRGKLGDELTKRKGSERREPGHIPK
jgi:arylsulfatase